MPHEPLTGDALLDALSEVPGDPAEPVPAQNGILWTVHPDAVKPPTAPYHGKSLWGWAPNADIPHVVSVPIEAALADLRARLPDDPWSAQYQGQSVPDPGQSLDDAARRSVEWRKVTSLLSGLRDRHWNDDFSARPLSEPTPEQRQAERDAEFDRRHVHDASDPYTHHYLDVVLSIPSHKQTDPPPASEALIVNPIEEENPE